MTEQEKLALRKAACRIRKGVVIGTFHAKSGHPGGSLSVAEVLAYLYHREMRVDPRDPQWPQRDRLVLSKGHAAPALYAALADRGYFPPEELTALRHMDSRLQGHPNMNLVPGVDMSTGSLGQGISAACGMAKAAKFLGRDAIRCFAILGDGEIQEGEVWEAFMFASHYKLDNLCIFIDLNGLQIDGAVQDVMGIQPVEQKLAAFGFDTVSIDGHDFDQLEDALARFHAAAGSGKPTAVLMHTVKGKGVSYMENVVGWHGKAPNEEEYRIAMQELDAAYAALEQEGENG